MPRPCNIDARGKRVRLIFGLVLIALAIGLGLVWALPTGGVAAWAVAAACLLSGAFVLYEARSGWCALRALGIRTPF